ncbi:fatty acid--CoA ligase [Geodermatophilus sp. TF02-6]|nr:fatty acid--CoA ligase [Geodermatophilus sp. TF02-6]
MGAQAVLRPDAPAVTHDGTTVTFAELDRAGSAAALALVGAGVRPGDRVAVLAQTGLEYVELLLACARAGAVAVTLNWRLSRPEIADILQDAEPVLVCTAAEFTPLVEDCAVPVVLLGPSYRSWVAATDAPGDVPGSRPSDVAALLYTSGTTGRPKGVVLTHEAVGHARRLAGEVYDFGAGDTMLVAMPLFHVGGLAHLVGPLLQGGHAVLMAQPRPVEVLRTIERHRVTHAFFVPTVIQSLLAVPEVEQIDLSGLRRVVYGAAPISETVLLRAMATLRCEFQHAYGLTEAGGTVTSLPPEDHDPGGPRAGLLRSCGRPVPWAEVALFDPASGRPTPPGDVGELWVRSSATMTAYWRRPGETASVLTDDSWLRTGDAASQDSDGYVVIHDRYKDMIISGGENVYPAEVDRVLSRHPAVSEVAVIGVPHATWGETVRAVVVLEEGASATGEELIAFARQTLAHYKCPTSVDFVGTLPRNASGKILKGELRARHRGSARGGRQDVDGTAGPT